MATIMGIYAQRHSLNLKGMKVRVEKHMSDNPRRIGKLVVNFEVPMKLAEKDQNALEASALACPVHKSLHPDIEFEIHFHYLRSQTEG